jgi:hypothetical protein
MIKVLQRKQVDDERWNRVISSSINETIYPYSWFLDACADNWLALIMNDYECVMPVAFRRKLGLKYTYQPIFCQQLGIYSEESLDSEVIGMFLQALNKNFKMGDYSFNEGNLLAEHLGYELTDNSNYVLALDASYDAIHKKYSENCRRNVKKANHKDLEFTDKISIDEIISLKKKSKNAQRSDKHNLYIKKLFTSLEAEGKMKIYGARNGTHLIAAAVFAFSKSRSIFLLSASSEQGKELRAMFLVVDSYIRMYANKELKLDFEGSNIASIARFFSGFGAKPERYQRVSFQNPASKIIKKLRGV